jgi:bifunctional DNA-binding transcriptional regulator/antitoxin component of YhaV-PrlF toxin-antitoxin module
VVSVTGFVHKKMGNVVIQRGGKNRQYYLICPAPLAQALEIEKGEVVEWVVEDKHTLLLKRTAARRATTSKRRSGHVER